jgi:hypothetical protein
LGRVSIVSVLATSEASAYLCVSPSTTVENRSGLVAHGSRPTAEVWHNGHLLDD